MEIKTLADLHLVTFGDGAPSWKRSAKRLATGARSSGMFRGIHVMNGRSLDSESFGRVIEVVDSVANGEKGFGYWVWKPAVTLQILKKLKEGEILLYLDAGCSLNVRSRAAVERFQEYIALTIKSGALAFQLTDQSEFSWNKFETVQRVLEPTDFATVNSNQLVGGVFFLKKCEETVSLVKNWLDLCLERDCYYLNDKHDPSLQLPGFIAHRHDQAIWSLLYKKSGFVILKDETYFFPKWKTIGRDFPIWATRNRSGLRITSERSWGRLIRKVDQLLCDAISPVLERTYRKHKLQK